MLDEKSWNTKRLNFDARKYPERKDLRENFILDIAQQLPENSEQIFLNKLKWKPDNYFSALINDWINKLTEAIPCFREYVFNKEKRELSVIEELLKEILITIHIGENWKPNQTIYIVIEDIDRSWDAWVYFLQTLNYFLKKIKLWEGLKVIAIATIWNEECIKNIESYLKCIDFIHNSPIISYSYWEMLRYYLDENCCDSNLIEFINYIWKKFNGFTPRILKHILRDLIFVFEEFDIDESSNMLLQKTKAIIWILVWKYINDSWTDNTFINTWKLYNDLKDDTFKSFLLSTAKNDSFYELNNHTWKKELLNPNIVWEYYVEYKFYDFRWDDSLIVLQYDGDKYIVYLDKKLLSI